MAAYEDTSLNKSFTLDISMDDKATLKAGTDVGWQGTKGKGIFMSTQNPQQYREHDFVGVENQLTPSAFRAMKWKVDNVNDHPSLVRTYDQSFVTVRPKDKDMLGSSGGVWASEQIRLVQEYPSAFCQPTSLPSQIATFLLRVLDQCFLYSFCSSMDDEEVDLESLTTYEEKRKGHLHEGLLAAYTDFKEISENILDTHVVELSDLISVLEELLHKLTICTVPKDTNELIALCDRLCDMVKSYPGRPVPFPVVIELTDKGPGAGIHNTEVQELFVLVCKVLESGHRIRLHRAPHDSAQNEAERTNAAIGEALTTGKPVEPPIDPFHGLTAAQMEKMTLKEIEAHCALWKVKNTWKLTSEVSDRIHDESGPGKHDFLISVPSYPKEKQIVHFLAKYLVQWRKASADRRVKMCANSLCMKLQELKKDHVRHGHYFLEYLKFACEPTTCESCEKEGWTAGVPANWFPVPDLSETTPLPRGYIPSNVTSVSDDIDKRLPSVQVKKLFASGDLSSCNATEIKEVCQNLMVDEATLKSFVQHREFLSLKAKKREEERNSLPDINWKDEGEVKSLTAKQLKMYLKQNNLHVTGSKAALVSRTLQFSHSGPQSSDRTGDTEFLSSDSEYDSPASSTLENQSDLDSDDSDEMDVFVEHTFEVLFVADDDIKQVSIA